MAKPSSFELNDTLQISKAQWFPEMCDIESYMKGDIDYQHLVGQTFSFVNKEWLRNFVVPPVRCFLVESMNGKWIYRWLCHIIDLHLDYEKKMTSWTYKIIHIYAPAEIPQAFQLIDRNPETNYFA